MDHDDYDYNRPKRSELLGLLFIFAIVGILMFFTFPTAYDLENYYPQEPSVLTIREGVGMGTLDKDHENLISQIRKDLKLQPYLSIEIFVGPYQDITGEGAIIPLINPPGVVIFLDQDFYQILSPEERTALVAHELGHLTNEEMLTFSPHTLVQFQIEADTYATKYVNPVTLMSVLNKIITRRGGKKPREYEPRIKNLENLQKLKQAH